MEQEGPWHRHLDLLADGSSGIQINRLGVPQLLPSYSSVTPRRLYSRATGTTFDPTCRSAHGSCWPVVVSVVSIGSVPFTILRDNFRQM